jgi:hypothetical protein
VIGRTADTSGVRTVVTRATLALLCSGVAACGLETGPGGVHEGDYFAAKLENKQTIEGAVSGWVGSRWIEVHRTGELVLRIDLDRLATFKVRCSHD